MWFNVVVIEFGGLILLFYFVGWMVFLLNDDDDVIYDVAVVTVIFCTVMYCKMGVFDYNGSVKNYFF